MAESKIKAASAIDDLEELSVLASETDQESIEEAYTTFPLLQWINGNPVKKKEGGVPYTGGWFIAQSSVGDLESLPGWTKDTFITRSGVEVPGYFKRDVEFAFLLQRRHWRVMVKDGDEERAMYFPWNDYDRAKEAGKGKKPTGNVQWLVWVKDLDMINPMVLTVKGYVSAELTGSRTNEGVGGAFSHRVVGTINNALHANGNPNNLPWRAFWMRVGPQINDDGTPKFTTVGSGSNTSTVTLPALIGVKRGATPNEVKSLYVGKDLLRRLNELWHEERCQAWAAQWNQVQVDQPAKESEAAPRAKIADIAIDGADVADLGDEGINF